MSFGTIVAVILVIPFALVVYWAVSGERKR